MALANASHGVGGGARFLDFWRISAVFDPIWEGTRTTGRGPDPAGRCPRSGVRIQRAGDRKAGLFSGYRGR